MWRRQEGEVLGKLCRQDPCMNCKSNSRLMVMALAGKVLGNSPGKDSIRPVCTKPGLGMLHVVLISLDLSILNSNHYHFYDFNYISHSNSLKDKYLTPFCSQNKFLGFKRSSTQTLKSMLL